MSAEREPSSNANWPTAILLIVVVLTVAVCFLGRIEALPWQ